MIPPLTPGQSDDCQNMIGWKNTFNMRQVTLMNLAANHLSLRGNNQTRHVINCMQNGCIASPLKSLDILRKNIQNAINKDIDNIIKKYIEKFFQPAVNNIRNNLGRDSINEDHIKEVCCKILDEAKSMYSTGPRSRDSSPYDYSDSETGSLIDYKFGRPTTASPLFRKRKESDTDSETSQSVRLKKNKVKVNNDVTQTNRITVKRDSVKWNPDRINGNTLFIMGAKANKVLGFGQTRGRLYVRHPELVRYSGDQEDKEWLTQHNLMPPSGGKAYLMVLEDIQELTSTEDYKSSPNLQLNELKGFEVPPFMLNKIRTFMESIRTETKISLQQTSSNLDLFDFQTSQSMTPPSTALDSAPSTPSDTLQMLECQSASTASSKQSDTNQFVQIPEVSPGSNHSFLSGALTQSPLSNTRVSMSVSPHLLLNFTSQQQQLLSCAVNQNVNVSVPVDVNAGDSNHSNLSAILATHMNNDHSDEPDI